MYFQQQFFFCLGHACYHVPHDKTRSRQSTDGDNEVLSSIPKSLGWTTGTEGQIWTFRSFELLL
jgi:hypothetical protein